MNKKGKRQKNSKYDIVTENLAPSTQETETRMSEHSQTNALKLYNLTRWQEMTYLLAILLGSFSDVLELEPTSGSSTGDRPINLSTGPKLVGWKLSLSAVEELVSPSGILNPTPGRRRERNEKERRYHRAEWALSDTEISRAQQKEDEKWRTLRYVLL